MEDNKRFLFFNQSFNWVENIVYLIIVLLLLVTIGILIYNAFLVVAKTLYSSDFIHGVLKLIDHILLTLMVVEILYTVKISIQLHKLSAAPFFIIGLIASVRRILIISVESAYLYERFNQHMIEMGILGFIILVFVLSLILCNKYKF